MQKRDSLINDLTRGPLTRQLLLFALPMVLSNLLNTVYTIVDMAVVGQFCGSSGLSAVSTAGNITMLLYGLGMGLATGSQILVSQQVGAKDKKGVTVTVGTTFTFTLFLAVSMAVLGIVLREPLLGMLNTPAEAWQEASDYLFWCSMGVPFTYVCGGMCALLQGMGESKRPMVFMGISAVANIILDLLLVAGFGMGAKGAAIATTASQVVGCVYCLLYLYRNHRRFDFTMRWESFRIDKKTLGTILRLMAPLVIQIMAINVSMLFINAWVNSYGVVASAVSGTGSKLYSLFSIVTGAMQGAVGTFTGQNIAAGETGRVKACMKVSALCAMSVWCLALVICLVFPVQLFSLFTREAAVLAMAEEYMFIQIFMYLGFALMCSPLGFLNGIGHVNLNLVIALADGVAARIGLSLLLAQVLGMGLHGYWWGQALAGFVSCIWGWAYFFSGRWKHRKLLAQAPV